MPRHKPVEANASAVLNLPFLANSNYPIFGHNVCLYFLDLLTWFCSELLHDELEKNPLCSVALPIIVLD